MNRVVSEFTANIATTVEEATGRGGNERQNEQREAIVLDMGDVVDGVDATKSEALYVLQGDAEELFRGDPTHYYRYEIGQAELLTSEQVTQLARRIERISSRPGRRQRGDGCAKERQVEVVDSVYEETVEQTRGIADIPWVSDMKEGEHIERRKQDVLEVQDVQDAQEARRQLIESNLRLVLHVANRYKGYGVDIMDLVQEGNIGLIHAVEKYDHRKGCRFSTYAMWWIRQYVTRALANQGHAIRVPLYKIDELRRLGRVRRDLQQSLDAEPTMEMLAEQMSIDVQEVITLLSMSQEQETISLDMPRKGGDEEVFLSDIIEDDPVYMPEQVVLKQTLQEQVQDLLSCLSQRERRVLQLRFGLNGQREHSLSETGRQLGLSHEAVRQVEFRALRKLDHPSRSRMLHDFLE